MAECELETLEDRLNSLTRSVFAKDVSNEQGLSTRSQTLLLQMNQLGQKVEQMSSHIAGNKRLNDLYEENRDLLSHHGLESLANTTGSLTNSNRTSGHGNSTQPSDLKRAVLLVSEDQIDALCADMEQLKRLSGSETILVKASDYQEQLERVERHEQAIAESAMQFHARVHQLLQQYKTLMQILSAKLVAYDSLMTALEKR